MHPQDIPTDLPGSDWRVDQAQGPEAEGAWGGGDVVFREGQAGAAACVGPSLAQPGYIISLTQMILTGTSALWPPSVHSDVAF